MEPVEEEQRRGYEMRVPPVMDGAEDDGEYPVVQEIFVQYHL